MTFAFSSVRSFSRQIAVAESMPSISLSVMIKAFLFIPGDMAKSS